MHIPDGYLSPQSSGILYAAVAPLWVLSLRALRRSLGARHAPLMALLAAFSFLVMMFNIPLPGGTTGHATGGVLMAILIGPWPALMAETLALAVQALLFGDGGILALGANAWNLAFVMPFAGYFVYRLARGRSKPGTRRFAFAAAAGAYAGINAAALCVAVELGLQPRFHHLAGGTPLYCPFDLSITIPAMMIPHLTIAGAAEALLTAGILAFLGRHHPAVFEPPAGGGGPTPPAEGIA